MSYSTIIHYQSSNPHKYVPVFQQKFLICMVLVWLLNKLKESTKKERKKTKTTVVGNFLHLILRS